MVSALDEPSLDMSPCFFIPPLDIPSFFIPSVLMPVVVRRPILNLRLIRHLASFENPLASGSDKARGASTCTRVLACFDPWRPGLISQWSIWKVSNIDHYVRYRTI